MLTIICVENNSKVCIICCSIINNIINNFYKCIPIWNIFINDIFNIICTAFTIHF